MSVDGFAAGTEQSLEHPLGKRGPELFQWFFHTRMFHAMHGESGGDTDIDDEFARRATDGFGAFILGRNCSAPFGANGQMNYGKAGGVTIRPITRQPSC